MTRRQANQTHPSLGTSLPAGLSSRTPYRSLSHICNTYIDIYIQILHTSITHFIHYPEQVLEYSATPLLDVQSDPTLSYSFEGAISLPTFCGCMSARRTGFHRVTLPYCVFFVATVWLGGAQVCTA